MNTTKETKEWLVESINFFRRLDFFPQYSHLSNGDLAQLLLKLHSGRWGRDLDPSDKFSDLLILCWDEQRVWWHDIEADVCAGNEIYRNTLQEWQSISRNAFDFQNIHETWVDKQGPVIITLEYKQQPFRLRPRYLDDFIDLNILYPINQIIRETGLQFELFNLDDQDGFVVALTQSEKERLEQERGWRWKTHILLSED